MRRMSLLASLPLVVATVPAVAHPGHGLPGWLHHGELLAMAVVVVGAIVLRTATRRDGR